MPMTTAPVPVGATLQLMSSSVLVDGRLQQGIVVVEGGVATSVLTNDYLPEGVPDPEPGIAVLDVGDAAVAPAPIDLHFHGAGGVVVPPGGHAAELDAAIEHICTRDAWSHAELPLPYDYLATLPAADLPADPNGPHPGARGDALVAHVAAAARGARDSRRCRGLRLEGTFVSPARGGVWPTGLFRKPDLGLLEEIVAVAAEECRPLRVLDVAPELPGAIELIERACELEVVVAMAHTDATYEQARRGIDAGATLATHTFNAMRAFHHRDPGVIAAVLTDPRVSCELICDGEHIAAGAIALASAAAPGRLVAVSDASPFAGLEDGEYEWLGKRIRADQGRLRDEAGALAGAACLLTSASGVLLAAGLTRDEALMAISVRPLQVLDPARAPGLEVGDRVWVAPAAAATSAG